MYSELNNKKSPKTVITGDILKTENEKNFKTFKKSKKFLHIFSIGATVATCIGVGIAFPFLIPGIGATAASCAIGGSIGAAVGGVLGFVEYEVGNYFGAKDENEMQKGRASMIKARSWERLADAVEKNNKIQKEKINFVQKITRKKNEGVSLSGK